MLNKYIMVYLKIYIWLGRNCFVCLFLLYAQSVTPRCTEQYIDSHCGQCAHPHSALHLWDAQGSKLNWTDCNFHTRRGRTPQVPNSTTGPPSNGLFCLLPYSVSCSISQITWLHSHEAILLWQMKRNWGLGKQSDLNKVIEPGSGIAWFMAIIHQHHYHYYD